MSTSSDPSLPAIPQPTTDPASQLYMLVTIKERIENLTAYVLALKAK